MSFNFLFFDWTSIIWYVSECLVVFGFLIYVFVGFIFETQDWAGNASGLSFELLLEGFCYCVIFLSRLFVSVSGLLDSSRINYFFRIFIIYFLFLWGRLGDLDLNGHCLL